MAGHLALDPVRFTCTAVGQPVDLTSTEFPLPAVPIAMAGGLVQR